MTLVVASEMPPMAIASCSTLLNVVDFPAWEVPRKPTRYRGRGTIVEFPHQQAVDRRELIQQALEVFQGNFATEAAGLHLGDFHPLRLRVRADFKVLRHAHRVFADLLH